MGSDLWDIVCRTVRISGTAVLLSTLVGLPLGACFGMLPLRASRILRVVIHTGMALPPVVIGLLLYLLLSRSGPLGHLGWLFTPRAMILAQLLLALPFVVGITMEAVRAVPAELDQQLRSLGAGRWQRRWTILREARPGVVLAVAAALGRSLSEVGAVLIVGGNIAGSTRVLTTAIVLETSRGRFEFALALGGALLVLALAVNALVLALPEERFRW